jgi:hypothetical protein
LKKIRLCPQCGALGEQQTASDEVAYRVLAAAKVDMRATRDRWMVRVWICTACDTPTIEIFPAVMSQDKRRSLLGIDEAPLVIDEEGGAR